MVLEDVKCGRKVRFLGVGMDRELRTRLASMGLFPGTVVEVLQVTSGGAVVLGVQGSRISVGESIAKQMVVA